MALRLLSRSAAALVAQQLGPAAQRLPSDWNPFASLAGESDIMLPHAALQHPGTSCLVDMMLRLPWRLALHG